MCQLYCNKNSHFQTSIYRTLVFVICHWYFNEVWSHWYHSLSNSIGNLILCFMHKAMCFKVFSFMFVFVRNILSTQRGLLWRRRLACRLSSSSDYYGRRMHLPPVTPHFSLSLSCLVHKATVKYKGGMHFKLDCFSWLFFHDSFAAQNNPWTAFFL